jgi:AcrR family transcriptional regulator
MSPRSQQQVEKIRNQSTSNILDAAFKLMAQNGYEGTSISQIARKAGVSKGLIYNYFDSKEDLLRALINSAFYEADRQLDEFADKNPKETLERVFRWFFLELREHSELWRLITELGLKIDKYDFVKEMMRGKFNQYVSVFASLLSQCGFKDANEEAHIIVGLFDGIGLQSQVIGADYPLDKMEAFLIKKYCR